MALKLIVRNKARVPVSGAIPDEDGKPVKFDFVLFCKRYTQTQIDQMLADKEAAVSQFLYDVAEGWEGVLTAAGEEIPFSRDALESVFDQAGVRGICFQSYLKEVGATAKN